MNLARDLEGSWVNTGLGPGKIEEKVTYVRKGITLRANTDPTAFNFTSDIRLPPRKDAGSVAFSEAGVATLGGSVYGNPNEEEEEEGITIPDDTADNDSVISLSSDESDLWSKPTDTPGIIANITEIENANLRNEAEIALLMERIKELQKVSTPPSAENAPATTKTLEEPTLMEGVVLGQNVSNSSPQALSEPQALHNNAPLTDDRHLDQPKNTSEKEPALDLPNTKRSHSQLTAEATSTENGTNN